MRPPETVSLPSSPASSSARSVAATESCATRPIVRVCLRDQCDGSSKATGAPQRVCRSGT